MPLQRSCPFVGLSDSDTLCIEWEGHPRDVRLLDVNPERAAPGGRSAPTEFGRRTYRWARETVFKDIRDVVLEFPGEEIAYSNTGRLLACVFVGGENFNVRLVREGWSPCFNKYGYPRTHRAELEQAELWARYEGRGIWGRRGGRGDYDVLKSHWSLRAAQIESCRHAVAMGEDVLGCRRDYRDIVARARSGGSACVFADVVTSFHMSDGSTIIQLGSPHHPLSAYFPGSAIALAGFVEREHLGFGKPNYLFFNGTLSLAGEHPQIAIERLDQISTCPPGST